MNLIKCYQTHSSWYKGSNADSKPIGILWHDTGAGNPNLKRYVQPFETDSNYDEMISILGKNTGGTDWNHKKKEAGLNAWIGKLADGSVATVQAGEWERQPWGCGGGSKGSCNGYIRKNGEVAWINEHFIQFEICDDGYTDEAYFNCAYREACELTAYLCDLYDIDPKGTVMFNGVEVPTILCHADSYKLGLGSNHGDVYSWFKKYGYDMTDVRNDVSALIGKGTVQPDPIVAFNEGDVVKIKDGVLTYSDGTKMAPWVPKSKLYVRGFKSDNRVIISTVQSGAITGTVFAYDLILVEGASKLEEVKPIEKPLGTASTGTKDDEKKIWSFLLDQIGNAYGVAGLMGNLYAESALCSNNLQNNGNNELGVTDDIYMQAVDNGVYSKEEFVSLHRYGFGLAQWTYPSRKAALYDYAKSKNRSIGDLQTQMEFLIAEIKEDFKSVWNVLCNAQSVKESSDIVLDKYERPADLGSEKNKERSERRASFGEKYFVEYQAEDKLIVPPANGSDDKSSETPEADDSTSDESAEYISTSKDAQTFIVKLLNHIIDFIVRMFKS